ncbi:DUF397 domain-containing protein [Amycolatopsis sp. NPDC059027]|uniref:DUF397 domain-containing protein n=1 Tax=unclassified Amycolatopsis TaxID=2618356 RepID=UPI00366C01DA
MDLSRANWFKSSRSQGENTACVEVAIASGAVAVRDSKDPDGPALTLSTGSWRPFVTSVKGL